MPIPRVRVREVRAFVRPFKFRMPFRYGKATVTGMPVLHLRAEVEVDGRRVTGVSACGQPPLWFDKDPASDPIRDPRRALRVAADLYESSRPASAFALHRAAEPEVRRILAREGMNDLTSGYGIALLDAAVADALCSATGRTFHQALRQDLLGLGTRSFPARPRPSIWVRHTVGLVDSLVAADVTKPVGDGLPETLEEVLRAYRVRYLKIKVTSDAGASLDRLRRIAALLDRDVRITLDGNEQFKSMEPFLEFVRRVAEDRSLAALWRRTLWIEQPVERTASLRPDVRAPLREVSRLKPVIIDEADGTDEALDRGLALGYRGISAKNCKGLYRTLRSYSRVRRRPGVILSSEDLINLPIVPLHQDLAVAAALGISHSERNGHHYVRAFQYFSARERADALRDFPSLYRKAAGGVPVLRVKEGAISLREINSHGFGILSHPDWSRLEPVELPGRKESR